jgi:hypothetical protein
MEVYNMTKELRDYAREELSEMSDMGAKFSDKIEEFNNIISIPMKELEEKIEGIIGKKVDDVTEEEEEKILEKLPTEIKMQYKLLIDLKGAELNLHEVILDYRSSRLDKINSLFN